MLIIIIKVKKFRSLLELTRHLTIRSGDNRAIPVIAKNRRKTKRNIQKHYYNTKKDKIFALYRIK